MMLVKKCSVKNGGFYMQTFHILTEVVCFFSSIWILYLFVQLVTKIFEFDTIVRDKGLVAGIVGLIFSIWLIK